MKICPVRAEISMRTDRQTERQAGGQKSMTKLIIPFWILLTLPDITSYLRECTVISTAKINPSYYFTTSYWLW